MKEITRVFTVEVTQIEVVEDDLADKLTDEGGAGGSFENAADR